MEIHKKIEWNAEKAARLLALRGISMDVIAKEIRAGSFIKYLNTRGQMVFVVLVENYPVAAPYVEASDHIFLKTAYQTRKWKAWFRRNT